MSSILTCLLLFQGQAGAKPKDDFLPQMQARVLAATVLVGNKALQTEGSGVIVGQKNKNLYILTACHVVQNDRGRLEITVFTQNPRAEKTYLFARVVAKVDGITDLALVEVTADKPFPEIVRIVPLGETVKQNQIAAMSAGYAKGLPPECRLIDAVEKRQVQRGGNTSIFWESPEKAVQGRSGGPLVDSRGLVVGICSGTSGGKCYYTHIDEIHRLLKNNDYSWLAEKK